VLALVAGREHPVEFNVLRESDPTLRCAVNGVVARVSGFRPKETWFGIQNTPYPPRITVFGFQL
jgi:hypothetical protein